MTQLGIYFTWFTSTVGSQIFYSILFVQYWHHNGGYWVLVQGDQLAIGKETGRRLGMGTNMYPSSSLLGDNKNEAIGVLPIDELIENADGFAGVFPGKYFAIVSELYEYALCSIYLIPYLM